MKKLINDLLKTRDGKWSGAKMSATTAHTLFAIAFVKITLASGFVPDMWLLYGGFAIGHAITDRVASQVQAFKEKRLTAETGPTDVRDPAPQDPAV